MVKRIVVVFNLSFRTNIFIITYQPGPTNEDEGGDGEDETTAGGALVVFFIALFDHFSFSCRHRIFSYGMAQNPLVFFSTTSITFASLFF